MSIVVNIKSNVDEQVRLLGRLGRDIKDKAAVLALNKTADKARTEMTRAISSEYVISAADVRGKLRVQRASTRGLNLFAVLEPFASSRRGRSLNLIRFVERKVTLAEGRRRAKQGTKAQIGFKIKRAGGIKRIDGAFIANRGRTIFRRVGKDRLPIESVQTIDIPQMFGARRIVARVVARIQNDFPIEFERAARLLLSRKG